MMNKKSVIARIRYGFDCMMSKGPIAMSLLLLAVTAVIVGSIGIAAYFVAEDGSILFQMWNSLMYTLDAGNLAGVPTDNLVYLLLMSLATLCGLFLTSILIGIIETFAKAYISTQFSDAVVFSVLIIILLVKPAGLLGKQIQEKV